MTGAQRRELAHLLEWAREPVKSQFDYYVQVYVRGYLDGRDSTALLESKGVPDFVAKRASNKARVILGNERAARRSKAKEILEARRVKATEFTLENFRVTMETGEDRNYGMTSMSIYCVVEVWLDDDTVDREYLVNYSSFETKEWLVKLLVWALMNKREVLIKPATQEEMGSMKMFVPRSKENVA